MQLYSKRALFRAIQFLFPGGCGMTQFQALSREFPYVDIPGRKYPMFSLGSVVDYLQSREQPGAVEAEPSLHRRRGKRQRLGHTA